MQRAIKGVYKPNKAVLTAIYKHTCGKCWSENIKLDMDEERLEQNEQLEVILSYECKSCGNAGRTTI